MKILTFPETLRSRISEKGFPHVSFTMARKNQPEFNQIHLFIPLGITTSDGMNYGSTNLGLGGAAAGAAKTGSVESASSADLGAAVMKQFKSNMGTATLATVGELESGLIVNPYTAVTFEGVNVRQFEFAFKLVPTSLDESKTAHEIENSFRKYMYPLRIGLSSLEYPPTFRIKFMAGGQINKYMPKIIDTYLIAMTANYNATGNSFHENDGKLGAPPVEIDLNMTFQEVRAITRQDLYDEQGLGYNTNYDSAGVFPSSPDGGSEEEPQSNTGVGS